MSMTFLQPIRYEDTSGLSRFCCFRHHHGTANRVAQRWRRLRVGSSVFQGFSSSMLAAVLSMALFTAGEMVWGPRFLQLSVEVMQRGRPREFVTLKSNDFQIADEGREGTGNAVFSTRPAFCARTNHVQLSLFWDFPSLFHG